MSAREKAERRYGQAAKDFAITRWKIGTVPPLLQSSPSVDELTALHLAAFNLAQAERDLADFGASDD